MALTTSFAFLSKRKSINQDAEWIRFFVRVTNPNHELIPPERARRLREETHPALLEFTRSLLERDPQRRPSMRDAAARFAAARHAACQRLPQYGGPPALRPASDSAPPPTPPRPSTAAAAAQRRAYLAELPESRPVSPSNGVGAAGGAGAPHGPPRAAAVPATLIAPDLWLASAALGDDVDPLDDAGSPLDGGAAGTGGVVGAVWDRLRVVETVSDALAATHCVVCSWAKGPSRPDLSWSQAHPGTHPAPGTSAAAVSPGGGGAAPGAADAAAAQTAASVLNWSLPKPREGKEVEDAFDRAVAQGVTAIRTALGADTDPYHKLPLICKLLLWIR